MDARDERLTGGIGCVPQAAFLALAAYSSWAWWPMGLAALVVALPLVALILRWQNRIEDKNRDADLGRLRAIADADAPDAWRVVLEKQGHRTLVAALEGTERKAIRLETTPLAPAAPVAPEAPVALVAPKLGGSRNGGLPDLPVDIPWPQPDGLAFLTQLNLDELPLPLEITSAQSGHLWFFGAFAGACRVYFRAAGTALSPARAASKTDAPYAPCAVVGRAYVDVPEVDRGASDDDVAWEAFFEMREYLSKGGRGGRAPAHKLFGHPNWIQDARLASGDRLLLQLDSDPNASMMLGDVGSIYFVITEEDLASWRFDRVVALSQCY